MRLCTLLVMIMFGRLKSGKRLSRGCQCMSVLLIYHLIQQLNNLPLEYYILKATVPEATSRWS